MASEDKIDQLIDRKAFTDDLSFAAKTCQQVVDLVKQSKQAIAAVAQAVTPAETIAAMQKTEALTAKTATAVEDLVKAVNEEKKVLTAASKSFEELTTQAAKNEIASKKLTEQKKALAKAYKENNITQEQYVETLAKVKAEQEALKVSNLDLNRALRNMEKESQAATGSLDQMRAKLNQMLQTFDRLSSEERQSNIGETLLKNIEATTVEIKSLEESTGRFQRNVGNYAGAFKDAFVVLEKELTNVTQKMNSVDESSAAFAELKTQQELLLQVTTGLNKEYGTTKQELRALEEAAQKLALAWGQNDEKVQAFIQKVGSAKDDIGDVKESIKLAASDTKGFDNLIGAAEGVAGAFSIAEGAAALFGSENEELQKTFVKLQALMTILNGLQAVQNELKRKDSIFTGVQTAATKLYTFATTGATTATKVFKAALVSTGVGALVIAIGFLIEKMMSLGEETDDTNKILEEQKLIVEANKNVTLEYNSVIDRQLKLQVATAKAAGESSSKVAAFEIEALKQKRETIVAEQQKLMASKNYTEDVSKRYNELTNELAGLDNDIKVKTIENGAEIKKELKERAKKASEEAKKNADKQKEIAERNAQAIFDIEQAKTQRLVNINEEIASNEENALAIRFSALKNYNANEIALIENDRKFKLSKAGLTAKEKEKIQVESDIKIAETIEKFTQLQNKLYEDAAATRNELLKQKNEEQVKLEEEKFAKIEASIQSRTNRDAKFLADKLKNEANRYLDGEISFEQYQKNIAKIEENGQISSIQNLINGNKEKLKAMNAAGKDTTALQAEIAQQELKLADITLKNKQQKDYEEIELAKQKKEKLIELAQEVFNFTQSLATASFEKQKNKVREELDLVEKQKQQEIEATNASALSQQEKADKIATIEAVAQSKKEALERRQRDIDNQRAKTERLFQIARIIGNTAMAVVGALAPPPVGAGPKAGIPLAAIIGAIGAVQIATILATPIPKYKYGTQNHPTDGPAIVGDGFVPEVVQQPGEKPFITPNKPTLINLKKGSKVFPNQTAFLESIIKTDVHDYAIKTDKNNTNETFMQLAYLKAVENKLDATNAELKVLQNVIKNLPIQQLNMDENGITKVTKRGNNFQKHIDNYFRN